MVVQGRSNTLPVTLEQMIYHAEMVGRAWLAGAPGTVEGFDAVLPVYGRAPDAARWHGAAAPPARPGGGA